MKKNLLLEDAVARRSGEATKQKLSLAFNELKLEDDASETEAKTEDPVSEQKESDMYKSMREEVLEMRDSIAQCREVADEDDDEILSACDAMTSACDTMDAAIAKDTPEAETK